MRIRIVEYSDATDGDMRDPKCAFGAIILLLMAVLSSRCSLHFECRAETDVSFLEFEFM